MGQKGVILWQKGCFWGVKKVFLGEKECFYV